MSVRSNMPTRQLQTGLAVVGQRASMKRVGARGRTGPVSDNGNFGGIVNPGIRELTKLGRTVPNLLPVYATHADVQELVDAMEYDWFREVGPGWRSMGVVQRLDCLATRLIQDHLLTHGDGRNHKRDIITMDKARRLVKREIPMTDEAMDVLSQMRPDHVRRVGGANCVDIPARGNDRTGVTKGIQPEQSRDYSTWRLS